MAGPLGYLTVWPTGQTQPLVSTLNDADRNGRGQCGHRARGYGRRHQRVCLATTPTWSIDINGYFAPPGAGRTVAVSGGCPAACWTRASEQRQPFSGTLSPSVDVVGSVCAPPSTAQAYVFNATVVPLGVAGLSDAVAGRQTAAGGLDAERATMARSPRTWRLCRKHRRQDRCLCLRI